MPSIRRNKYALYKAKRLSAIDAVRAFCTACNGGAAFLESCPSPNCALYKYRIDAKRLPLTAIERYCKQCAGNSREVLTCSAYTEDEYANAPCPLWPYRMGIETYTMTQKDIDDIIDVEDGVC